MRNEQQKYELEKRLREKRREGGWTELSNVIETVRKISAERKGKQHKERITLHGENYLQK